MNNFFRYDFIVHIFGFITELNYSLGNLCTFQGYFLKLKVLEWNIFGRLLNFKYSSGMPDIPDIFGG